MLRSFKPIVDKRSKVLVLGTMPGPEALRRREYYGFPGNHFWPILQKLFGAGDRHLSYPQKIRLVRKNRIALWDVIASCEREGASDGAIRRVKPNRIPQLLRQYPNIRKIFVNGKTAERLFRLHFKNTAKVPVHGLPSTSPAHAAMSLKRKAEFWSKVKRASASSGESQAAGKRPAPPRPR